MAKKRKKKKKQVSQKRMSPAKYIITKARNLEFSDCYINEDWQEN